MEPQTSQVGPLSRRALAARFSRRSVFGISAAAAAAGVVAACGGNKNNSASPKPTATQGASTAPNTPSASTAVQSPQASVVAASPAAAGRTIVPPPPSYSSSPAQKLLADYNWSKIGSQTQVLGTPRMGGITVIPTPGFGLQTLSPTAEPTEQWPFTITHSCLAGMDFSYTHNPDALPATPEHSLSQSWEQPDAVTLIFKLRPNVTWQNKPPANGEPLSIADIQATYQLLKASKYRGLNFADVDRIEDAGNGTVRFVSAKPSAHLLGSLRNPADAVLNAKHIAEGDDALKTKAIGTGPFTQEKFDPNTVRVYKRSPSYWEKDANGTQLPYLDGSVHTVIRDPAAAVAAFRSGQIDYYRPVSPEEFTRLQKELDTWAQANIGCSCQSPVIAMSMRDPTFKDVRVRRALSLAVNRQDILDTVLGGGGSATTWIPWFYRGLYWPETFDQMGPWMKYDPAQAKQLLAAAGVQTPLTLTLMFSGQVSPGTGAATGDPYVESVRRDLKAIGVNLDLKPLDTLGATNTFYAAQWNGLFSTSISGTGGLDADLTVQGLVTGGGLNGVGVSDPQVDSLFQKERATFDANERIKVFNQLEQYVNQDQLLRGIQLPVGFGLSMWRKYLHNIIDPNGKWISGGGLQQMNVAWLDDKVAKRDLGSY